MKDIEEANKYKINSDSPLIKITINDSELKGYINDRAILDTPFFFDGKVYVPIATKEGVFKFAKISCDATVEYESIDELTEKTDVSYLQVSNVNKTKICLANWETGDIYEYDLTHHQVLRHIPCTHIYI